MATPWSDSEKLAWNRLCQAYADRLVKERAVRSTTVEEVGEQKARLNSIEFAKRDIRRMIAAAKDADVTFIPTRERTLFSDAED